jgi:hypothetical protein
MSELMTKRFFALAAAAILLFLAPSFAAGYRIAPYKDDLFAYPKVLESAYGGDYVKVEYVELRDINGRDEIPVDKAKPEYLSLDTKAVERDMTLIDGRIKLPYIATGKIDGGAKAIVIYVHGRNGNRFQGANDGMFGGNFNRIKNLMMRNDGLYLSPSFADFGSKGAAEVKALILHGAGLSPGAPVFLACGSLGAQICWRLMRDDAVVPLIAGLILFDPVMKKNDLRIAAGLDPARRVPILITGSREDTVVGWRAQRDLFRAMKAAVPDYPIRYVLFSAGTHGLSLRMTDWRATLNWMLGEGE